MVPVLALILDLGPMGFFFFIRDQSPFGHPLRQEAAAFRTSSLTRTPDSMAPFIDAR